jgi:hypothetical protein
MGAVLPIFLFWGGKGERGWMGWNRYRLDQGGEGGINTKKELLSLSLSCGSGRIKDFILD